METQQLHRRARTAPQVHWCHETSNFVIHRQDCFGYSVSFKLPHEFLDAFFFICEEHPWDFDSDCIEFIDLFGYY